MTTPPELARAATLAMWEADTASRSLGVVLEDFGPGRARLSMNVTAAMINSHGICHGGYIFLLADSAFAYACNADNRRAVAQLATISYLRPAQPGDRLTAEAREIHRAGRSGLYDVSVQDQDGHRIAEFRGHSRTIPGTLLPEPGNS